MYLIVKCFIPFYTPQVLHEIGTENVNLKGSQMTDIIGLLKKEETIENIEKSKETIVETDTGPASTQDGATGSEGCRDIPADKKAEKSS